MAGQGGWICDPGPRGRVPCGRRGAERESFRQGDRPGGGGYRVSVDGTDDVGGADALIEVERQQPVLETRAKALGEGRYIGISEPGIIAAESPNPIVNELVVCPDIEKRLEAFVRVGHVVVVFPGGVGTAEEILYLLGILLHPDNADVPFPLIFTGPASAAAYFEQIDAFIGTTLGEAARRRYTIILDDPAAVAQRIAHDMQTVSAFRKQSKDAYYFNWALKVPHDLQRPFRPTHEAMRQLDLHLDQDKHKLAANLRRAFSGVVAGNVKADTIQAVQDHGPFDIHGDEAVLKPLDALLQAFVRQNRMKLPGKAYVPCYRVVV